MLCRPQSHRQHLDHRRFVTNLRPQGIPAATGAEDISDLPPPGPIIERFDRVDCGHQHACVAEPQFWAAAYDRGTGNGMARGRFGSVAPSFAGGRFSSAVLARTTTPPSGWWRRWPMLRVAFHCGIPSSPRASPSRPTSNTSCFTPWPRSSSCFLSNGRFACRSRDTPYPNPRVFSLDR